MDYDQIALLRNVSEGVYREFSLNMSADTSEVFAKNQHNAKAMMNRFWNRLPYTGRYKSTKATGDYTVNSVTANGFPDYYGGMYTNVDGRLVVTIKCAYFRKNYRDSDWYRELIDMFNSAEFLCRPVTYNYTDLVNGMSDLAFGPLGRAIHRAGVHLVGYGIEDYNNRIVIEVQTEGDAVTVRTIVVGSVYSIVVVGNGTVRYTCRIRHS